MVARSVYFEDVPGRRSAATLQALFTSSIVQGGGKRRATGMAIDSTNAPSATAGAARERCYGRDGVAWRRAVAAEEIRTPDSQTCSF